MVKNYVSLIVFRGQLVKNTYGHSSNPNDLTLLIWDPRFLWIPEHSMHIKMPKFKLAHSGSKIIIKYLVFCHFSLFIYTYSANHSPRRIHCQEPGSWWTALRRCHLDLAVSIWSFRCPAGTGKSPVRWQTPIRHVLLNLMLRNAIACYRVIRCRIQSHRNLEKYEWFIRILKFSISSFGHKVLKHANEFSIWPIKSWFVNLVINFHFYLTNNNLVTNFVINDQSGHWVLTLVIRF